MKDWVDLLRELRMLLLALPTTRFYALLALAALGLIAWMQRGG